MPYASTISFTLDTICPWTYLALLRLRRALSTFSSDKVTFTLQFVPYQLYPDFGTEGEDKYAWYLKEKYNGNDETMKKYIDYMKQLFKTEGIEWTPHGTMANTLPAHRILHTVQETHGADSALSLLTSLYESYFINGLHPSSESTLRSACAAAGLSDGEVEKVVGDEKKGLAEVKSAMREQVGNGVDSVPYVVVEGRRRDFTLVGAKEVGEYGKVLEQVEKES
ncbi:hypothetical protein DPSP01_000938 [Paraphaeosphaeria sporulosa]|uniref:Thioredoxin-like protein n=1 Tax=Paraphaeosphaeria sporulosa TaxID=1460663 RepID=A0A177CQV8_9PLEO|nr:thioredoxin-like protein [Paraphaeosphaeria sporulosa]OAG09332.1 thioredoxin-like protein [Paraphaeosphaeria sporulosa]